MNPRFRGLTYLVLAILVIGFVNTVYLVTTRLRSKGQTPTTYTVNYDGNNFAPKNLNINVGDTVIWYNASEDYLELASDPHPQHTDYPPLNLGIISPKESKQYTFSQSGTYGYHNHLKASANGTITVTQPVPSADIASPTPAPTPVATPTPSPVLATTQQPSPTASPPVGGFTTNPSPTLQPSSSPSPKSASPVLVLPTASPSFTPLTQTTSRSTPQPASPISQTARALPSRANTVGKLIGVVAAGLAGLTLLGTVLYMILKKRAAGHDEPPGTPPPIANPPVTPEPTTQETNEPTQSNPPLHLG
ncbi:MAG: hypothetical protein UV59_C0035G0010 [Candidatus Gottesmanbacteria bacterium GW2011_GWA1_43_11]|uniref:EfeO-type cupredoxin-like domain-containing protein n=1 Tax=Candidatus Gottesmanbacteria bacterium GW2011_GWA1_43_11 TaxID=1618436 RepID=A0A0G1F9V4_9BACT|nr:MAG: hypothetical protein UV59_C0035G0010 [Candidatus Gottesmanbacteria bacterium GW2011_GWA1_43_11]